MKSKRLVVWVVVGVLVLWAGGVLAQEERSEDTLHLDLGDTMTVVIDGHLHTVYELLKILEQSKVRYVVNVLPEDTVLEEEEPFVIKEIYQRKVEGEKIFVYRSAVSDSAAVLLQAGEDAFKEKDYPKALSLYRQTLEQDSTFANGWTLVGDAFYLMGEYDSAVVAFKKAIEMNYIDYDAHWFLADAYWDLGEELESIEEMTIAHVLNRNHETLMQALKSGRAAVGQPWKDWEFKPVCALSSDSEGVKVSATPEWSLYALVRALWRYEPGYQQKMTGKGEDEEADSMSVSMLEEKECLVTMLTPEGKFPELEKAIGDGYVDEFIWYEIWLKKYPASIQMMPDIEATVERIVEYINKYH